MDYGQGIDACHYVGVSKELPVLPCSAPLSSAPVPPAAARRLAASFRAVGDPARLRLLSLIQAQPDGEACVCHLIPALGLSQSTVSHHLKVLLRAGLLAREQRGVWAWYRVVPESLRALRAALG